jgi:protein Tex
MNLATDKEFQTFTKQTLPGVQNRSVQAVLELHSQGATVPFMARYRKEKTGNLDEVQIRAVIERAETWQELVKRKEFVITEIAKQGALTDDLKKQIETSYELNEIEELYRPYKKKKKTKAKIALDAGMGPLADWITGLGQGNVKDTASLEVKAKEFIKPDAGFATYEEALRGAQHIIVEKLSNVPELRAIVKTEYFNNGRVVSTKTKDYKTNSKFSMYVEFSEAVKSLQNKKSTHRYLALRRGWQEGELKVTIEANDAELLKHFENHLIKNPNSQATDFLKECAKLSLTVHVIPSVTNELHGVMKEKSDLDAINVFAENVRRVLMSSPFGAKVVLGLDPGIRTGCKIALVDKSGRFLTSTVMQIQGDGAKENAKKLFGEAMNQIQIEAIAVGNGTAGRETEKFVREILKEIGKETPVVLVNESGASVYSASDVAREEFPDLDLTVRGAISIARRLQDPLAELVKIEPKSIGVGQYQHDVAQNLLKKSLHDVVESCVNQVGVDVNTASESLLQYVAGVGPAIAKNIVKHRAEKGLFQERSELEKVPHLSSKAYEQAAGFLRIRGGKTSLDATGIHPERYKAVRDMLQEAGIGLSQAIGGQLDAVKKLREKWVQLIGEYTFDDIVNELAKPGRDPRDPYKIFKFREDIHELKDLKPDLVCPGIVTNVTNFGAFVDVGVHQDGLVHISQLTHDFVDDPRLVVNPGDQVTVKVMAVDVEKSQISLTMKLEERPAQVRAPRAQASEPRAPRAPRKDQSRNDKPREQQRDARGPRPPQHGDRPRPQNRDNRGSRDQAPRNKPAFNNPFAALIDINKK